MQNDDRRDRNHSKDERPSERPANQVEGDEASEEKKALLRLIKKGDVRGLRQFRQEHKEFPSLAGETFKKLEVTSMDLSFIDLSNCEFDSCIFDKSVFRKGDLSGAFFTGCTILHTTFEETNMESTAIDGCVIHDCKFVKLELTDNEISGNEFARCTFEDIYLIETDWESVTVVGGVFCNVKGESGSWSGLTFRDVILESVDIEGIEVQACVASGELLPGFKALTGRRKRVK